MALSSVTEHLRRTLGTLAVAEAASLWPVAEALLTPLRPGGPRPAPDRGDPDGLSGIGRRGPWARLEPSQWALLDVNPEELLRRAVDGELNFWELAEAAPRPPGGLIVWLDTGPALLGAPRVVQIAALAALDAHAAHAGVPIRWGLLPEAPGVAPKVHLGLRPGWLDTIRRARDRLGDAGDPPPPAPGESVYVLSSSAWAAGAGRRAAGTVLELNARGDEVTASILGRSVPLPPAGPGWLPVLRLAPTISVGETLSPTSSEASQTGLVRGVPAEPIAPGFFFSSSGARLLCWSPGTSGTTGQRVWAIPLVGPADRRVHTRVVPGTLVAAGWVQQRLGTLTALETGGLEVDLGRGRTPAPAVPSSPQVQRLDHHAGAVRVVPPRPIEVDGRAWQPVSPLNGARYPPQDAPPQSSPNPASHLILLGRADADGWWSLDPRTCVAVLAAEAGVPIRRRVPFQLGGSRSRIGLVGAQLCVAAQSGPAAGWTVGGRSLSPVAGHFIGFIARLYGHPGALLLSVDGLMRVGLGGAEALPYDDLVIDAVTCPQGRTAAVLGKQGVLTLFDLRTGKIVLRAGPL